LYPNPTEDYCTLLYRIQEDGQLLITDAQGKLVWQTELKANSQQLKANSLLIQTFTNGIYFYTIQTPNGSVRGKFVVRK
ncbi:T9SS type A sorting domain-containing protein, partial [Umezakia ovalisporum]|uniref:T9SS type A sorting domain-containing protein n=1 Tax=Umezakia ovalisporum TaxID=75695 RepID=UPI0039C71D8C